MNTPLVSFISVCFSTPVRWPSGWTLPGAALSPCFCPQWGWGERFFAPVLHGANADHPTGCQGRWDAVVQGKSYLKEKAGDRKDGWIKNNKRNGEEGKRKDKRRKCWKNTFRIKRRRNGAKGEVDTEGEEGKNQLEVEERWGEKIHVMEEKQRRLMDGRERIRGGRG